MYVDKEAKRIVKHIMKGINEADSTFKEICQEYIKHKAITIEKILEAFGNIKISSINEKTLRFLLETLRVSVNHKNEVSFRTFRQKLYEFARENDIVS